MSPALASLMTKFLFVLAITEVWTQATNIPKTTQLACLNGGINEGNRCRCLEFATGTRCQTIIESITIGKSFEAKMQATLTLNYTGTQENFNSTYTGLMSKILTGINGRHVDTEPKFNKDEVTVTSDIFLTIEYTNTTVVLDYEKIYNKVLAAFNQENCKPQTQGCINSYTSTATIPTSKEDRCAEKLTSVFLPFFDPMVTTELGLSCVSKCAPSSPDMVDCNDGTCQILGEDGPQCFCPRNDLYLYTYPRCGGAVLIAALYGGVGASVGLLVIVGVVLGIFFYRKKYYY